MKMMRNDDRSVNESTNLTIFSIFDINKMKIKNNKIKSILKQK